MAYLTAVLARSGPAWRTRDVEIDDARTLDELADTLRGVAVDEQPVIAVVEHEDEWFAVVRVDGEEEPRLFVSDLAAASRSSYGDVLATAADVPLDDEPEAVAAGVTAGAGAVDEDDDEDGAAEDDQDVEPPVPPAVRAWAGEPDLLDDLGVSGPVLRTLVEERGDDPGGVLADVGESVGFGLLEALR